MVSGLDQINNSHPGSYRPHAFKYLSFNLWLVHSQPRLTMIRVNSGNLSFLNNLFLRRENLIFMIFF